MSKPAFVLIDRKLVEKLGASSRIDTSLFQSFINKIKSKTKKASNIEAGNDADMVMTDEDQASTNEEGLMLHQAFPELKVKKVASAYIRDIKFAELPREVRDTVKKFVTTHSYTKFILYNMVVSELLPKVDHHNFDKAEKHVAAEKVNKDEVYKKSKDKYILLMNDSIIDGHHFLAKAKKVGLTSSISVLDLTPSRFQKTALDKIVEKI